MNTMMKKIIDNIKSSWNHVPYTMKHIIMMNKIAWSNFHTIFPLHDVDKLLLYIFIPFMGVKKIHKWHRDHSHHHDNSLAKSERNYIEMVCDWESARFTKPDKPLNAADTALTYFPHLLPILDKYLKVVNK